MLRSGELYAKQTLAAIFMGEVKQWDDPSITRHNPRLVSQLEGKEINVVYRTSSSGTTEIFTRALSSFSEQWEKRIGATSEVADWDKVEACIGSMSSLLSLQHVLDLH